MAVLDYMDVRMHNFFHVKPSLLMISRFDDRRLDLAFGFDCPHLAAIGAGIHKNVQNV